MKNANSERGDWGPGVPLWPALLYDFMRGERKRYIDPIGNRLTSEIFICPRSPRKLFTRVAMAMVEIRARNAVVVHYVGHLAGKSALVTRACSFPACCV